MSSISSGVVIVLIIVLSPMTSYMRSSLGLVADIGTGCVSVCVCVCVCGGGGGGGGGRMLMQFISEKAYNLL